MAPLSVGADGSLTCAGHILKGASVCILDGEPDKMVEAAGAVAREARDGLRGSEPAGAIIFDCVCRGMILDGQFDREIQSVRAVLGDVPIAGFLTYGEIARYSGKLDGWHNTTAVVLAIPGVTSAVSYRPRVASRDDAPPFALTEAVKGRS